MQVLPAKNQENCRGTHFEVMENQNEKHLVNLCESNNLETQAIFPVMN